MSTGLSPTINTEAGPARIGSRVSSVGASVAATVLCEFLLKNTYKDDGKLSRKAAVELSILLSKDRGDPHCVPTRCIRSTAVH